LSEYDRELIQISQANTERLIYQVEDILEFSNYKQIEKIRISPVLFDLKDLLKEIKNIYSIQMK
jgi:signal transduction histidine kinase